MQEFFGVDFGTTNSAVVGRFRRNVTMYHDGFDQPFPSLVAVARATGEVAAVGREAWIRREALSESCAILTSAKTQLGKGVSWRIGPETWTPERVVTEVLAALKRRVSDLGQGACLDHPVIAIPVGFSPQKRRALRRAAADAGIAIRGFVSEPTAAVFRSFEAVRQWPIVVVFDWGGGTLDVSVVRIQGNIVYEVATVPNPLGGDDLDVLLAEWAHTQILRQKGGGNLPFSGMSSRHRDALISQCETAKRELANEDESTISLVRYGEFGTINLTLSSVEFERLMKPKIDEAIATLENGVIQRAGLSFDQIGCVIMVGGSSKLRGLEAAIAEKKWSCSIKSPEESDWHVADGAAVLASNFGHYVSSQSVGVRLCDDTVYPIIKTGQTVDREVHRATFGLIEDTNNARFVFVEGKDGEDGHITSIDKVLGRLVVPAYGFSDEPLHLNTWIDDDLLLHVEAHSKARAPSNARQWTYAELRFRYALPEDA